MNVVKRDGRTVPFDKNKIKLAVLKSFLDVDGEETAYAKDKAREIANYVESFKTSLAFSSVIVIISPQSKSFTKVIIQLFKQFCNTFTQCFFIYIM